MKHFCTIIILVFTTLSVAQTTTEQDSLTQKNKVLEDNLNKNKQTTLIDGKIYNKETVPKPNLEKDNPLTAKIDSLWMQELYASKLFDSIYKTIANLDYDKTVEYDELPTALLKERLQKIDEKTPFNIAYNPQLENVIKSFLKYRKRSFGKLMAVSQFYYPMFEQELDNYNVPLEVKHLSIVESALDAKAKSRVGATGLWQFMFNTGKIYDLNVSSYVDERSDPIKSTKAAAQYLAKLHKIFDDWDLALAAYNAGPGNVAKAIRRSGGHKNYWNLRPFLPKETAGYVPAFLATLYIFEYAKEHGIKPQNPPVSYFETDTIHVKKTITFEQISEIAHVDVEQLQFFNPSYKLDIIPYIDGKNYYLRLPKNVIGNFVTNEDAIYAYAQAEIDAREKPLPELLELKADVRTTYRVKQGDYLGKIAEKFGVSVSNIKRWNRLRSNNLKIGQRLIIHAKKRKVTVASKKAKATTSTNVKTYTVKQGDTLWGISQKFPGISVQNLKDWNSISGTSLKPGMTLKMCKC